MIPSTSRRYRALRGAVLVTLVLLILQYVLGMLAALYVAIPDSLPGGNAWAWTFAQAPVVQFHAYLGTLLVLVPLVAVGLSIAARSTPGLVTSGLGLALIVVAWLGGVTFLSAGQEAGASLWMALGFLGALIAFGLGYYLTRPA